MDNSFSHIPQKFELHYFFSDDSHTMDAIVRNKCESEIIFILKEISEVLDIKIEIETEALVEGGLKELYKFATKNKIALLLVTDILVNVFSHYITRDYELVSLQKQEIHLSITEKELNIEKLRQELKKDNPNSKTIISATDIINSNKKIIRHKSNFYKNLDSYPKVIQISTNKLRGDNSKDSEPIIIPRSDFKKFILLSDELPTIIDEEATIEIISPVLKKGKLKWRGIYQDKIIDFFMKDKDYKNSVLNQEITFKNGSIIECVLEMCSRIDEVGNEFVYKYSVIVVIKYRDDFTIIETKQGKKYKAIKEFEKNQFNLFN